MTKKTRSPRRVSKSLAFLFAVAVCVLPAAMTASAQEMDLRSLVSEALKNNPDLAAAQSRIESARHRVPQASALPDPSVSVGYTNSPSLQKYTFGDDFDSVWATSLSQQIPFPGKLIQKRNVASKDVEVIRAQLAALRLQTVSKVKELYYDLFLAHRTADLLEDRVKLFDQVEKAALARYASGLGDQRDAVMAQSEKYMMLERLEMSRQKIGVLETQLNAQLGRDVLTPVGKPAEPVITPYGRSLNELLAKASFDAPDVKTGQKSLEKAQAKVSAAKQEFFPDITLAAGYARKGFKTSQGQPQSQDSSSSNGPTPQKQNWEDMWSGTVSLTIPLWFWVKQSEGLKESKADLSEARHVLESARNMAASAIRENYLQVTSADRLIGLYKAGTIPKSRQDFELAAAGYAGGKGDIAGVVTRLKGLVDSEISYWGIVAEKQKAEARLESVTGLGEAYAQALARPAGKDASGTGTAAARTENSQK